MSPLRVRLLATPGGQEGCPGAGTLGKGELCCPAWPPSGRPCPARGSQGLPEVTEKELSYQAFGEKARTINHLAKSSSGRELKIPPESSVLHAQ